MRKWQLGACTSLLWMASWAGAEEPGLQLGEVAKIQSQVLGEERRLNLLLPAGYATSQERFPVLFLLDGSAHEDFFHAASLVDFLGTYGAMPRVIVVGISNVDRRRDFTPPSEDPADREAAPTHGGADRFLRFLEEELIPWVQRNYRTTERRILVGQSFGGLLGAKILLEKGHLFTDYLLVSPSLWWNRQALLKAAEKAAAPSWPAERAIYVSVGEEHPEMRDTAQRFVKRLSSSPPTGQRLLFDDLQGENHATALHISLYRGLKFLTPAPPPVN